MTESFSAKPLSNPSVAPPRKLDTTVWLILIIASIGFAFDIYELLMLPLILPPAVQELLAVSGGDLATWRGLMFWVPAMAGGLFGLYGGYLTDLLGRRRVLTWSILLYAVSAFLAGFSTNLTMLLILRSTTFIGVCVEFVAAVAWLAELFPNHEQRERVLGYTQACSSIGGLMVAAAFYFANQYASYLPPIVMPEFLTGVFGEIPGTHAPWRYTLMSGLIPALPLILIRPFLPESPIWAQKKEAGTLKRPSFTELFRPPFTRTTVLTTLMVAASFGTAFGAIQQMPQIVPGMAEAKEKIQAALAEHPDLKNLDAKKAELSGEAFLQKRKTIEAQVTQRTRGTIAAKYTFAQEIGGLVGRFLLALLVVRIVSRQSLIRVFLVPGIFVMPLIFGWVSLNNQTLVETGAFRITLLHVGMFLAGVLTVGQFSFWGNYLPTVYPVHLRGTGESVAHNIGGRMLGTSFAFVASEISKWMPGETDPMRMAYAAAFMGGFVFVLGFVLSFFLPEPKEEMMHQ